MTNSHEIGRSFLGLICVAVLCTILGLGLWPFHSPRNEVSWLENHNGLRFGRYGTVVSSGFFQMGLPQKEPGAALEIWIEPRSIWDTATFLAFYTQANRFQFSLYQSQHDLLLRTGTPVGQFGEGTSSLVVRGVFRRPGPVFVTISSATQGVSIFVDGVLAATGTGFSLSAKDFTGGLVLGDSAGQNDSWSGQLLGLAVYQRTLTPQEATRDYASWRQNGRPEINGHARDVAVYLFDERAGNVAHDKAGYAADLYIPPKYQVMAKIILQPFWTEFKLSRGYWSAALKNVVGFIPLGFFFDAYFARKTLRTRAMLVTLAVGAAISLTIEVFQAFLPTRESGTTDLLTNTLGTWIGTALYGLWERQMGRWAPGVGLDFGRPRVSRKL